MFLSASKYYDINRILLLASGLWPYQKSKFRHIQAVFFLAIILSFIVFQLTTFITTGCTINLVTKVLSIVLPMFMCVIKYNMFFFSAEKMRLLMDLMLHHWTLIRDKEEIAILEKYTQFTKRLTILMLQFFSSAILVVILGHLLPLILDIITPLNSTRPRHLYITTEYFVDQEKYFLLILLHFIVSLSLGYIIVASSIAMVIVYMQHACALLKIASYRIRSAVNENSVEISSYQRDHRVYERIISGICIHRKAIEFTDLILSHVKMSYSVIIVIGVTSLALCIFQVFSILIKNDMNEMLTTLLFLIAQFSYMYLGSYAGQTVSDHYTEVFDATYYSNWYMAPLRAQRLLLFIMQRTSKNFYFVFGGIFALSLKGFSTLASMSISYFTVIYSLIYTE